MRCRPALDVAAGADSAEPQQQAASSTAAVAAASEVLRELLGQNWRVELDAGLGGALGGPDSEALLLVCAPQAVAQLLAAVADVAGPAGAGQEPLPSGAVWVVSVAGTQEGDDAAARDWRQLDKQLALAAVQPGGSDGGGDDIAAALAKAVTLAALLQLRL